MEVRDRRRLSGYYYDKQILDKMFKESVEQLDKTLVDDYFAKHVRPLSGTATRDIPSDIRESARVSPESNHLEVSPIETTPNSTQFVTNTDSHSEDSSKHSTCVYDWSDPIQLRETEITNYMYDEEGETHRSFPKPDHPTNDHQRTIQVEIHNEPYAAPLACSTPMIDRDGKSTDSEFPPKVDDTPFVPTTTRFYHYKPMSRSKHQKSETLSLDEDSKSISSRSRLSSGSDKVGSLTSLASSTSLENPSMTSQSLSQSHSFRLTGRKLMSYTDIGHVESSANKRSDTDLESRSSDTRDISGQMCDVDLKISEESPAESRKVNVDDVSHNNTVLKLTSGSDRKLNLVERDDTNKPADEARGQSGLQEDYDTASRSLQIMEEIFREVSEDLKKNPPVDKHKHSKSVPKSSKSLPKPSKPTLLVPSQSKHRSRESSRSKQRSDSNNARQRSQTADDQGRTGSDSLNVNKQTRDSSQSSSTTSATSNTRPKDVRAKNSYEPAVSRISARSRTATCTLRSDTTEKKSSSRSKSLSSRESVELVGKTVQARKLVIESV